LGFCSTSHQVSHHSQGLTSCPKISLKNIGVIELFICDLIIRRLYQLCIVPCLQALKFWVMGYEKKLTVE